MKLADKTILVTGGTGSFGQRFVEHVLAEQRPRKLIVFSRDELKQHEMKLRYPDTGSSPLRYLLGDVRDRDRLHQAFHGVDLVVHAAALKQVPSCEHNPFEAVQTNILGAKNVIDAATDNGVECVLALSTDKAVNPVNLYGATKQVAEKLFVQGNSASGRHNTRLACIRYGNVVGSRGSVVPLFQEQRKAGVLTTDKRMTRFWITLDQVVRFVIDCAEMAMGGEVFVPKIPSMRVTDLAEAVAPGCKLEVRGIRPGEKLHEMLVSAEESRNAVEFENMYVIQPLFPWWEGEHLQGGKPVSEGFSFESHTNSRWLSVKELRAMAEQA
jgi:UDP-N-acetylglucosamine 4,6-dehydratase/5-epimerase